MGDLGGVLYCGCDDSNHKGKEGHEIILAAFSFYPGDEKFQEFKNRKCCRRAERERIYIDARKWMKDTIRDYRFVSIEREDARFDSNIPIVLPDLIRGYMKDCPYDVQNLRVFIDGEFGVYKEGENSKEKIGRKEMIVREFPDFPNIKVRSVVKKRIGKKKKRAKILYCPKVVRGADIWANMVYRQGVQDNLAHPKRIVIS